MSALHNMFPLSGRAHRVGQPTQWCRECRVEWYAAAIDRHIFACVSPACFLRPPVKREQQHQRPFSDDTGNLGWVCGRTGGRGSGPINKEKASSVPPSAQRVAGTHGKTQAAMRVFHVHAGIIYPLAFGRAVWPAQSFSHCLKVGALVTNA